MHIYLFCDYSRCLHQKTAQDLSRGGLNFLIWCAEKIERLHLSNFPLFCKPECIKAEYPRNIQPLVLSLHVLHDIGQGYIIPLLKSLFSTKYCHLKPFY